MNRDVDRLGINLAIVFFTTDGRSGVKTEAGLPICNLQVQEKGGKAERDGKHWIGGSNSEKDGG
jgi:hypothetical protein